MHVLLKCNYCFVNKIIYNLQKERYVYSKYLIVGTHKNVWDQRQTWLLNVRFVPPDGIVCGTCVFAALVPTHWMTYLSLLLYRTLTLLYLRFLDCRVREREICDTDIPCTFLATPHDMNLRIIRLFFILFLLSREKHLPFVTVLILLWQYVMSLNHILGSYTNILMLPASGVHLGFKRC